MINFLLKLKAKMHIFFIFTICYFSFGVYAPTKMAYINNTVISYGVTLAFYVSYYILMAVNFVRGFLHIGYSHL